jgi:MFS family permease
VSAPAPSAALDQPFRRALGLDVLGALGLGVTVALVSALLPTIARQRGLEPIGLAALGAAPFIANLLSAFAGRFGPRSARQMALMRGVGAASLVLVLLVPTPPVMIAVAVVYWLSLSFSTPYQIRMWGLVYPARLRGRIVGILGMARAATGAGAALAGGIIADRLGGPTAVALAGAIGLVASAAYIGVRAVGAGRPATFSARQAIHALRDRPVLARVAVAQGFYGGGVIAAGPLFALVHVDRLGLSLADVGVLGVLAAVGTTIAFPSWGAVSDRFGPLVVMRVGGLLGVAALTAYALAPAVGVLWVAALLSGTAGAAIDIGVTAVVSEQTTLRDRAAAMAGWNALTGARGIAAAFLMSALVQWGVVDVSLGLLLCAGSSAFGVALFARTRPEVPVESRAWELAPASRPVATALADT